jgi:hypothetical protein
VCDAPGPVERHPPSRHEAVAELPLATDEERRIVIGPGTEVAPENRHETPKERLIFSAR